MHAWLFVVCITYRGVIDKLTIITWTNCEYIFLFYCYILVLLLCVLILALRYIDIGSSSSDDDDSSCYCDDIAWSVINETRLIEPVIYIIYIICAIDFNYAVRSAHERKWKHRNNQLRRKDFTDSFKSIGRLSKDANQMCKYFATFLANTSEYK